MNEEPNSENSSPECEYPQESKQAVKTLSTYENKEHCKASQARRKERTPLADITKLYYLTINKSNDYM